MKEHRKIILITTVVTLAPILIGLILWNRLPERIATHWGFNGEANGWSSKAFAVFGLPLILAACHLFSLIFMLNDPKKNNIHKKPMQLLFWCIPVISFLVNGMTYLIALGTDLNISILLPFLVGILFILLGNYLPKLKQNYTVGIKLPWTLNSEENWNRTHRLGGKMMILCGFLIMAGGLFGNLAGNNAAWILTFSMVLVSVLIPTAYSFWLFKKGI